MRINTQVTIANIVQHNDPVAFRTLFNAYYEKLLGIARYFIKSEALAEDIVAEVFINIWKHRDRLAEVDKIDYYLFTVTKRKAIDHLRKLKEDKVLPIDMATAQNASTGRDAMGAMMAHEFEAIVHAAIAKLPPKCRLIFKMVKEDGLKYQEVADLLELSIKTIEFHIGKALKDIKADIDKYLSDDDVEEYLKRMA